MIVKVSRNLMFYRQWVCWILLKVCLVDIMYVSTIEKIVSKSGIIVLFGYNFFNLIGKFGQWWVPGNEVTTASQKKLCNYRNTFETFEPSSLKNCGSSKLEKVGVCRKLDAFCVLSLRAELFSAAKEFSVRSCGAVK